MPDIWYNSCSINNMGCNEPRDIDAKRQRFSTSNRSTFTLSGKCHMNAFLITINVGHGREWCIASWRGSCSFRLRVCINPMWCQPYCSNWIVSDFGKNKNTSEITTWSSDLTSSLTMIRTFGMNSFPLIWARMICGREKGLRGYIFGIVSLPTSLEIISTSLIAEEGPTA